MPLNRFTLTTGGTWETTSLMNSGEEIEGRSVFLDIVSQNFADGNAGGLSEGICINDARVLIPLPGRQDEIEGLATDGNVDDAYALCSTVDIFPGSFELVNTQSLGKLRVEFNDPGLDYVNFRVFLEEMDITKDFCKLNVAIDSIANQAYASCEYVTERHMFGKYATTVAMTL